MPRAGESDAMGLPDPPAHPIFRSRGQTQGALFTSRTSEVLLRLRNVADLFHEMERYGLQREDPLRLPEHMGKEILECAHTIMCLSASRRSCA